ncbi:MAG TPA: Asp-tRNA(Asn)/Glu-tRNA(Gln) amidotransferase subunit GatB [Candidatus Paceibacterota bacterium]
MVAYRATIGLEIHAELKTQTKMFCACRNDADERTPNKNICPVCLAHPGTLPVINKEAVHKVLLVGRALGATLADYTEFDRKNYFYPDIPKGYQLSQYAYPLVSGGVLGGVAITRVHLEEDTARSLHDKIQITSSKSQISPNLEFENLKTGVSLLDYNRAGVPLMELVTEPVMHSAEEAGIFAKELQILLRYLGVGDANMEKGELRIEANVSVAPTETNKKGAVEALGTKVEVKNLNSFRSVEKAICFEVERQSKLLDAGGTVEQETLGWDEAKQATYVQRKKEGSADYRYFPDPDLPKLKLSEIPEFAAEVLRKELPELPWERRARYLGLGLKQDDANMFVSDEHYGALLDAVQGDKALAANYIASDLAGLVSKYGEEHLKNITAQGLSAMLGAITSTKLSSRGAKDALADVFVNGGDLELVIKKYEQQSDEGALLAMAQKVLDAHPAVAADYKAGKAAALQFLLGQGMKESKGSANPEALKKALIKVIGDRG